MTALRASELSVKKVSIFGDTENCSLGFHQLDEQFPSSVDSHRAFVSDKDIYIY